MKSKLIAVVMIAFSLGTHANAVVVTNGNATLWSTTSSYYDEYSLLYIGTTDDPVVTGTVQSILFAITGAGTDTEFFADFDNGVSPSGYSATFSKNSLTGYYESNSQEQFAIFSNSRRISFFIHQLDPGFVVTHMGVTVPEPSSAALLGVGVLLLMNRKRRH